jgi:hypothetical protein
MLKHVSRPSLLVLILASFVVVGLPATKAHAAPACSSIQSGAAAAAAMARACNQPVEDISLRTPDSRTVHNADGTQELTEYAEPQWAKTADGTWSNVDTNLRLVNGAVVPGLTALPVSFSAGGTGTLAKLSSGSNSLAVSWPGPLPAPTLSGDTATYAEVQPGVDLQLTATPTGFSEVLVVKTRAAAMSPALAKVQFGLSSTGVSLAGLAHGGAEARDSHGNLVFSSPTPLMWDSADRVPDATGARRPHARFAVMGESLTGTQLSVVPDQAMLGDTTTTLPLYIDPSWNGGISGNLWKNVASRSDVVNSTSFTLLDGSLKGDAASGETCDSFSGSTCTSTPYDVRSLFLMDMSGAAGKHVLKATFNITQKWSWTCSPASNAELWIAPTVKSSTTWNNQGTWDSSHTAQAAASHREDGAAGCSGNGTVTFNATAMVQFGQSNGWSKITLGLRAINESTNNQWKRFAASTAGLSIVYNTPPNVPDTFSTAGQSGCVTGSGRPLVAVTNPVLSARVTDPDGVGEGDIGGSLKGNFAWEQLNTSTGTWSALGSALGTPQAGGTTNPSPAPTFATGIYHWHVRADDSWSLSGVGSGTDSSAYGPWCEFEVDATPPNPATLTPDAANSPFVTGKTVRVSASPGGSPADTDITGYNWWVVDGNGTHATTFVSGSSMTLDWTPIAGQGTLHVQAKDRIQFGPESTYSFNAAQPSTEVARWGLDDFTGSTTAVDRTGNGHNATATLDAGSTLGAPGRIVNGATVLSLDGGPSTVDTGGPVVDTSKSFTVSAWADPTAKTANGVVVSQIGTAHVPFTLGYVAGTGEDRWEFVGYDSSGNVVSRIRSDASPVTGVWTELTAVYDSGASTVVLYVDGQAEGSASISPLWNAGGAFQIGHGIGEPFTGDIADVRVWDRTLAGTEVSDLVDPTSQANLATDNVGQWLVEPSSCFGSPITCQDTSAYAHDINLSGGVSLTDAGQSGSGLQYVAANQGIATTIDPNTGVDGPVLRTDQSFTVGVWVNLAEVPTENVTALGQSGEAISGFYLGARMSDAGTPRWSFSMKDTDAGAASGWPDATDPADITASDVGVWTHLIAVYDATAGTITLYVNGSEVASASRTATPWNATHALTIGAVLYTPTSGPTGYTDWWDGRIDTVYAYQGAVPAGSISRIP